MISVVSRSAVHRNFPVVAMVISGSLYIAITALVATHALVPLDLAVRDGISRLTFDFVIDVSAMIARLGQGGPLAGATLCIALFQTWRLKSIKPFALWTFAFLALNAVVGLPKVYLRRGAPADTQIDAVEFFSKTFCGDASCMSYPSGHAANAVVWYGLIGILFSGLVRSRRFLTFRIIVAFLTAVSTVVAGYHWTTDTAAGVFAGIALLYSIHILNREITKRTSRTSDPEMADQPHS